ncbi:cytochrome c4 [Xanthomonadaceae bacterium XH05]|jgi:cytochrome c553|nr:cytochrome c4 [Xanthomonadaceae bacterium XH05]
MKLFSLLFFSAFAGSTQAMPALDDDAMTERLAACAACHGARGEGTPGAEYYPHLAGKPAGYLFVQMQGFRDGRRHYPQMVYLMRNWDDAWLWRIADFYSSQPMTTLDHAPPAALPPEQRARAMQLVHEGDAARGLPACTRCHGAHLEGREPGIPALAGLPVDYLIAQLGGWLTGARHSLEPDCMSQVVQHLQPGDIRLVSTYLAGLVPDLDSRPMPASDEPLPLACGGTTFPAAAAEMSP